MIQDALTWEAGSNFLPGLIFMRRLFDLGLVSYGWRFVFLAEACIEFLFCLLALILNHSGIIWLWANRKKVRKRQLEFGGHEGRVVIVINKLFKYHRLLKTIQHLAIELYLFLQSLNFFLLNHLQFQNPRLKLTNLTPQSRALAELCLGD